MSCAMRCMPLGVRAGGAGRVRDADAARTFAVLQVAAELLDVGHDAVRVRERGGARRRTDSHSK
eukprot:29936-Pelagococcus_subviridis.AAC.2